MASLAFTEAIRNHLEELRDSFKFVWSEYLKWYTFLSTLNLLALTFIQHGEESTRNDVVLTFAVFDVLGSLTTTALCYTPVILRDVGSKPSRSSGKEIR